MTRFKMTVFETMLLNFYWVSLNETTKGNRFVSRLHCNACPGGFERTRVPACNGVPKIIIIFFFGNKQSLIGSKTL